MRWIYYGVALAATVLACLEKQPAERLPDVATLAANVEAYTALNPSLLAVIENAVAAFAADPRLAPAVAATNCSTDVASIHSLVRIWCGLPSLDPYPVMPDPLPVCVNCTR